MRILIGIPSFRRPAMLARTLDSIADLIDVGDYRLEVFVADNDPLHHEALALCAHLDGAYRWPIKAEIVAVKGISAARNHILAEARRRDADMIAMVDDDETVSSRWLAEMVATKCLHGADIVGGAALFRFDSPPPGNLLKSGAFAPKQRTPGPVSMIDSSCNILMDCKTLARLSWPEFDENFGLTGGEDKEFFTRLRRAGASVAWSDQAIVHEYVPAARTGIGSVLSRAFGIGGSDYRIAAKHGEWAECSRHLLKSAIVLATALPTAPALVSSRWRLWLLRRHARALGRLAAALGITNARYGGSSSP